jgi:integrase
MVFRLTSNETTTPWRRPQAENLRLHDLRHSYASALVSSGASLPLISAMLGHASPATSARYSHMYADPMRAAAEKIATLIENAAVPPAPHPDKVVQLDTGRRS